MSDDTATSKRTRASGEVLEFLLQEFEANNNPLPEQRREISDKTAMTEKAVRIWFQNRRAKIRKVERMSKTGGPVSVSGSYRAAATASIHSLRLNSLSFNDYQSQMSPSGVYPPSAGAPPIELNDKYCFIDCLSLLVGSWQRIKLGYHDEQFLAQNLVNLLPFTLNSIMPNVDLLVILLKRNFEINYFFLAILNNLKILFRIFYPISAIRTCLLLDNNINKENSELRVDLAHQPKFSVYFFNGVTSQRNQWSICDDFSEGQQVSQAYLADGGSHTPHVLVGVKNLLQYLNLFILQNNQVGQFTSEPESFQFGHGHTPAWEEPQNDSVYKVKDLLPLGQFDSDISPNSITSNTSHGNGLPLTAAAPSAYDDAFPSHHSTTNSVSNFAGHLNGQQAEFDDMFNPNTPDFVPAPTSGTKIAPRAEPLIHSPSTHVQDYTHQHGGDGTHSPFPTDLFAHENFDFDVQNDYTNSPNDHTSQYGQNLHYSNSSAQNGDYANNSSSANNQVDSFIDFNAPYR